MAERYPSSLRSVKSARSLRRRSGTHNKNEQEDTAEPDTPKTPSRSSTRASTLSVFSGKSRRMSTIVEDGDTSRPRGSRRASTFKNAPLPPLPTSSPNIARDRFSDPDYVDHYERHDDRPQPFSDVPLTPMLRSPDLERGGNSTTISSRLPTPDFSRQNSVRSRLSIPIPQRTGSNHSDYTTTLQTRINGWRSDNETLTKNRPPLVPAPSSNWTQKWPKPRLNPRSLGGLVTAVGESEGLGLDKPDKWTTHKWVLLMSILIGFGYSSVGLGYAMLTWFRGEWHPFPKCPILRFQQGGNTRKSCTQRTAISWSTSLSLHPFKSSRHWSDSAVSFSILAQSWPCTVFCSGPHLFPWRS